MERFMPSLPGCTICVVMIMTAGAAMAQDRIKATIEQLNRE